MQADTKILDFDTNYRYTFLFKLFGYINLGESDYFKIDYHHDKLLTELKLEVM